MEDIQDLTQPTYETDDDGVWEIKKCGENNGSDVYSRLLIEPSESYTSNQLEEQALIDAEEQAQVDALEAKKTEVETLKQTIESKVSTGDFDPEYFAALGRYTVLTREVVL